MTTFLKQCLYSSQLKNLFFTLSFFLFNFSLSFGQTDSLITAIESYLNQLNRDVHFSVSIAIAQGDELILKEAYGEANREHGVPNRTNTRFNIASIGKLFTTVAILQLYEQGKLELKVPIGKYLPDFPNQQIRTQVSIHQLLTHTSGLPLWFNEQFDQEPKFQYRWSKDYLPLYEPLEIDSAKVGQYRYSNVGFMLLGYIIEKVYGFSYSHYLGQKLFKKLGMSNTGLWQLTEIIPRSATGYMRPNKETPWWSPNHRKNKGYSPAGGAYSTPEDLLSFYQLLLSHQLLRPETTELMLTPKVRTPFGHYGYGIALNENNGHPIIGHLGGYYGIRGELMWYKNQDIRVAILANSDQTDYIDLSYFIKILLTGTKEQQRRYRHTQDWLAQKGLFERLKDQELLASLNGNDFDEDLIQIKGYYQYNKAIFWNAKRLFQLNAVLFPDSERAKRDLEKFNR